MNASTIRLAAALVSAALCVGCASPSTFAPPAVPVPARLALAPLPDATAGTDGPSGRPQALTGERWSCGAWWRGFGNARVDALVARALRRSPTVEAAQATMRQAHELALAQSAALWPSLDLVAGATHTHGANGAIVDDSAPGARTVLLSAAYSPDVFGVLAHTAASARAQEDAARWALEASRLTLADQVVDAVAAEDAAAEGARLLARLVAIDEDVLRIVSARQVLGDVPMAAVWAQRQQVHDRRAALAAAQLQAAHALTLLASLAGGLPADVDASTAPLAFTLPDIPARLAGTAILQRPDVRMAAAQLHAADASREAALAARFPQIALTAQTGYGAGVGEALFGPASVVWDLGASLTQSVFDAGAHRHQAEAADAFAQAQEAQYRGTVSSAFRSVADALEAVRRDAEAAQAAADRTAAAQRQWEIAAQGQSLGDGSRQDVLAMQSALLQNQLLEAQARSARLADTADAFAALGGTVDESTAAECPATAAR